MIIYLLQIMAYNWQKVNLDHAKPLPPPTGIILYPFDIDQPL